MWYFFNTQILKITAAFRVNFAARRTRLQRVSLPATLTLGEGLDPLHHSLGSLSTRYPSCSRQWRKYCKVEMTCQQTEICIGYQWFKLFRSKFWVLATTGTSPVYCDIVNVQTINNLVKQCCQKTKSRNGNVVWKRVKKEHPDIDGQH